MSVAGDWQPAAITGWGAATPLGTDADATWDALLAGRFVADHAAVPLERDGEVDRLTQLGLRVAREAVTRAAWGAALLSDERTALIVGTSKGPVEAWLRLATSGASITGRSMAGPRGHALPPPFGLATTAHEVANALCVTGPRLTLSAACSSGLQALGRATLGIAAGEFDRALVVAVESSLHPLFLANFRRLGILPPPGVGCRPFDRFRQGFLMSEAAAAVCVERSSRRGAVLVERFAAAADATHLTGSDPTGGPLRHCLSRVAAGGGAIDLVHAHGTATDANDPVELAAVESVVVPPAVPSLYSHKGALGHSLGAAGLVSVVLNCIAHGRGVVPPNVCTTDPLPTRRVTISPELTRRSVRRSLAIAAGFGGAIAAVALTSAGEV